MSFDFVIVGSGLTGATIARMLKDKGYKIIVLERRNHLGGNVYDSTHPSGIRIHTYGPHYFRTSSERIWKFVNRFSSFYKYEASIKTLVDNEYQNWPISDSYIRKNIGKNWKPDFKGLPSNFEEASLSMMPRMIYEKFIKGYTEKQWGVPAISLSASLAKRFDVRLDDEPRLMRHKYQGIPEKGYSEFMKNMLNNIPVILNIDYLKNRNFFKYNMGLIFTGPIDEFFGYKLGKLKYRGQRRKTEYLPDIEYYQPSGQINNPDPHNGKHIRILEWKHMMPSKFSERIKGTVITKEIPITPNDPDGFEYPFPDVKNSRLYGEYKASAQKLKNITICGRLGEYKYYDMDQAIARAMKLTNSILENFK